MSLTQTYVWQRGVVRLKVKPYPTAVVTPIRQQPLNEHERKTRRVSQSCIQDFEKLAKDTARYSQHIALRSVSAVRHSCICGEALVDVHKG